MLTARVLLTGFEPFGGESVNPSLEAVKQLHGRVIGGAEVVAEAIPTEFGRSIDVLERLIRRVRPDTVICVGQAGGRARITPERVAINWMDAPIPDNAGQQPVDAPIVPGGPVAYWSTLPVKRIVSALREAGIPAAVSYTAGTYVCNHLFYGLMHLLDTQFPGVRGGFIHVPFLPEQTVDREAPSMSLQEIVRGLAIAVEVSVGEREDVNEPGGRVS